LSLTKPITSFAWRGQSGKLSAQLLSGGRYFFTVNLAYRRRALLTDPIDVLRGVSPGAGACDDVVGHVEISGAGTAIDGVPRRHLDILKLELAPDVLYPY